MDQGKIGEFLKELRKEKIITQEQLSEKLNVSRRTVSRWETGSNLPDLDVLVELADFYEVDLRDIFNGKRRGENMESGLKDTLLQAADYTNELKKKAKKRVNIMFIVTIILMCLYLLALMVFNEEQTFIWGFLRGIALGVSFGMMILGAILTSPLADKFIEMKSRTK
ncbi:MAG: helix-turn-helix domain-containing protein [Clostridiales bacterium]|nr:helix-turn-helix domain-containing protein [Clostridiales bacterium]